MISLFLDSASSYMIIGIYKDTEELYLKIEKNNNHLSEHLLPEIKQAFDVARKSIWDINRIYVVNGPGSFTGVRIGVAVAKTIAWALHKDIIPISELELIASTDTGEKNKISLIDARRECVYAGVYDKDLNLIMKDTYISLKDLLEKKDNETVMLSNDSFAFETMTPKVNIASIIEKHKNDIPVNPHELKPNYLKRTEAEEKRDTVCE